MQVKLIWDENGWSEAYGIYREDPDAIIEVAAWRMFIWRAADWVRGQASRLIPWPPQKW